MEVNELRELQNKLYIESRELVDKILRLEDILFSQKNYKIITKTQLNLLDVQLKSMKTYYQILCLRMENLDDEIIKLEGEKND